MPFLDVGTCLWLVPIYKAIAARLGQAPQLGGLGQAQRGPTSRVGRLAPQGFDRLGGGRLIAKGSGAGDAADHHHMRPERAREALCRLAPAKTGLFGDVAGGFRHGEELGFARAGALGRLRRPDQPIGGSVVRSMAAQQLVQCRHGHLRATPLQCFGSLLPAPNWFAALQYLLQCSTRNAVRNAVRCVMESR
jgi:hypothetical protein